MNYQYHITYPNKQVAQERYTKPINQQNQSILNIFTSNCEQTKLIVKKRGLKSSYNWTKVEHLKYVRFVSNNKELFELSKVQRKKIGTNILMSKSVESRNSVQCHSHHQKMVKKYGSIQNIIDQHLSIQPLEENDNLEEDGIKDDSQSMHQNHIQVVQDPQVIENQQMLFNHCQPWRDYCIFQMFVLNE